MYWSLSVGARHTFSSIGLLSSDRFANDIDENRPVRRSSTYRNVEPSTVIEASLDEATWSRHKDMLKDDEFIVASARVGLDRFSGGMRAKVQHVWSLADARARFGRYLLVNTDRHQPNVARLLQEFPAIAQQTDEGVVRHGLKVRLGVVCTNGQQKAAVELNLGDAARFFPSDQAMAAWSQEAGHEAVKIVYESAL